MTDYDKTWELMNDLEQSFSQIATIEFLSNKLIEASDTNNLRDVVEISQALVPVYTKNFDEKFKKCWEGVVTPELKVYNQLDKDITGN
jgi:phenylacetate-coenzyme A ligase PaaK-like adenylate-forming protein